MPTRAATGLAMFLAVLLVPHGMARAEPPSALKPNNAEKNVAEKNDKFVRLAREKNGQPVALETALVRLARKDNVKHGPVVDLVAAIHVADASYYRRLNEEFKGYEAVLYELIAPENLKVPQGKNPGGGHPVSLVQNWLKDVLNLEFQLRGIDYTRNNMVHADMSPDQFAESMRQRGESALTVLARMLGYELARRSQGKNNSSDWQILAAFFEKNRALALKRALAEQFEDSEAAMAALEGPQGSTLISGRNQKALEVLRRELTAGKKKVAIFYGAAHMPDLAKRLSKEFGLVPIETRWLAAWNLRAEKAGDEAATLKVDGTGVPKETARPAAPDKGVRRNGGIIDQ